MKIRTKIKSLMMVILFIAMFQMEGLAQKSPNKAPSVPEDLSAEIQVLQPGVKLTLLAEHPALVTPTGIDVDELGRIWVVSCHTHFRPENYDGPEHDEVLIFDKDGQNRSVFYSKTDATMHLLLGTDGWVYLAERDRILRVKDTDGDGKGDLEENIASLETIENYPHNGLSGMAWHPDGGLIFSLGENMGKDWTLTSRDGTQERGRGEGGIFWCALDGKKMRRIAKGFWNPFGLLARADGEIFAAENDPGSRPPCRLLNIVEGADYGYQWVYGSAPIHPFVAWNGELRGTLGMLHSCGEGPCAVVELGGGVMIPSWSNHCIDYFPLHRKGAGYTSKRIELLNGSDFFRPVCMAKGPDGAFYLTDWVFSSYQLHGRGRLWRLEMNPDEASWLQKEIEPKNSEAQLADDLRSGKVELSLEKLLEYAKGKDPVLSDAALTAMARSSKNWTVESLKALPLQDRLWGLVALRRSGLEEEKWVRGLIDDSNPDIRFECLRWIADGVLTSFLPNVEKMLSEPQIDFRQFEAVLATWNTLRGKPEAGVTNVDVLFETIRNPSTPSKLQGYALRLIPPANNKLSVEILRELFAKEDQVLRQEVVRTLATKTTVDAWDFLKEIILQVNLDIPLRADAVAGLANATGESYQDFLVELVSNPDATIRQEAIRSLRSRSFNESNRTALLNARVKYPDLKPLLESLFGNQSIVDMRKDLDVAAVAERLSILPGKADIESGRRIFFHSKVGTCASCHRFEGRGNVVGPDLSLIQQQGDQLSILRSILEPNRDVAPQFYSTVLQLDDGNVFTGILLRSSNVDVFRDSTGKERTFQKSEIVQRKELEISLMPTGLANQMSDTELRDLLAFLVSGKLD